MVNRGAPLTLGWMLSMGCPGESTPDAGKDTGEPAPDSAADSEDTGTDTSEHTGIDTAHTGLDPGTLDQDRDGFTPNQGDCDDQREHVYPGAPDYCDGLDADCDGDAIPDGSCSEIGDPLVMWTWSFDGCPPGHLCYPGASLGDVDGDGAPDLPFRTAYSEENGSELGVLSSASMPEWAAQQALPKGVWRDNFPQWNYSRMWPAGDFDADGLQDVWVYTSTGSVYTGGLFLMLGREGGFGGDFQVVDDAADAMWLDRADYEYYGRGLVGTGDINGDGLPDAVVTLADATGGAWAWIAGSDGPAGRHVIDELPQVRSEYPLVTIGWWDEVLADLDGDGFDEVVELTDRSVGDDHVVAFIEGEDLEDGVLAGDIVQDAWLDGTGEVTPYLYLGNSTFAGDIDGDGLNDLAISLFTETADSAGYCIGIFSGGVPEGDLNALQTVHVCGVDAGSAKMTQWQDDVDEDGIRDIRILYYDGEGTLPSTRLREGGVLVAEEIVGARTDFFVPLTTTADFDGDGLPEWVYWDETWRDPTTSDEVGRTLILAGFEIPWDDESKW